MDTENVTRDLKVRNFNTEKNGSDSENTKKQNASNNRIEGAEPKRTTKPDLSYIAMISKAIQSSPSKQMLLSDIYDWIAKHYPYYKLEDRSWRNSIRHNLSLNECFIKCGRSESGKGNYWSIHPANMEDFGRGDFRRRRARLRVRKCDEELRSLCEPSYTGTVIPSTSQYGQMLPTKAPLDCGYIPMSSSVVSVGYLTSLFGVEALSTREDRLSTFQQNHDKLSYW